jgi:uncharacterized membrane protein YhfC
VWVLQRAGETLLGQILTESKELNHLDQVSVWFVQCGENSRIFRDGTDLKLPVTNFFMMDSRKIIYLGIVSYT